MIEVRQVTKKYRTAIASPEAGRRRFSFFRPQYEEKTAVDNLNFRIEAGEIVGFIGPNGAGKSTTIKRLCGILQPNSSEIRINGTDPMTSRKTITRMIGAVFGQRTFAGSPRQTTSR